MKQMNKFKIAYSMLTSESLKVNNSELRGPEGQSRSLHGRCLLNKSLEAIELTLESSGQRKHAGVTLNCRRLGVM